jgi:hypothetical protein
LLASAEGYTPRANQLIDAARERIAPLADVANALADNLPAPKVSSGRSRRRRRRRRARAHKDHGTQVVQNGDAQAEDNAAVTTEAPSETE